MSQNLNLYTPLQRNGLKQAGGGDNPASLVAPTYSAIIDEHMVEKWLGLSKPELKALLKALHLVPLGKHRPRTQKRFAAVYILDLRQDLEWLSTARDIITGHWRKMNSRKRNKHATESRRHLES